MYCFIMSKNICTFYLSKFRNLYFLTFTLANEVARVFFCFTQVPVLSLKCRMWIILPDALMTRHRPGAAAHLKKKYSLARRPSALSSPITTILAVNCFRWLAKGLSSALLPARLCRVAPPLPPRPRSPPPTTRLLGLSRLSCNSAMLSFTDGLIRKPRVRDSFDGSGSLGEENPPSGLFRDVKS